MKNIVDFTGLKIKLASPDKIKEWSHGEVTKPETINYRTLKPEKDGLFCERIFGPTKDWECYCGKYKRIRYRGIVCDKCGVEVTQSRVRRERMGHITLACPVAHIWYFKKSPSKLSLFLDIPPRDLEAVIYFAQYLVIEVDAPGKKDALSHLAAELKTRKDELKTKLDEKIKEAKTEGEAEKKALVKTLKNKDQRLLAQEEVELKAKQKIQNLRDEHVLEEEQVEDIYRRLTDLVKRLRERSLLTEDEQLKLTEYGVSSFYKVGMGAEVVLNVLKKIDINSLVAELRQGLKDSKGAQHLKVAKRLRLVERMRKAQIDPTWMVVRILPVIPPDLRPMVQLSGGRFATSDLNDLYRRIINRNNRLKHLADLGAPEIILRNEKRMLQEAVDNLIDTSKVSTQRGRGGRNQSLRSLSDMLRGKQGRFRQNLLGKRVDYSGRSVIVVGPDLKLDQCGLPKEMALEMFKPFVLRELILSGLAPNVKSAKYALERRPPEVFDILEKITKEHPVLLNRAPTLHRLGIQAFFPVLIEGEAIRLHPCVCKGFNADFDGDQMAVHIPLGKRAIREAQELMSPSTNLLRPADGSPITIPNKDMALGCYFLTTINADREPAKTIFAGKEEAVFAFQEKKISLRQKIKVRLDGQIIETTVGRIIFNEVVPAELGFLNADINSKTLEEIITKTLGFAPRERVVQLIDDLKNLGFWAMTISGLSVGVWDCEIYPDKDKVIDQADDKVAQIEENFRQGLISPKEKKSLTQEVWMDTTDELAELTWERFAPENAVKLIIDARLGRTTKDQVKQLSAMQGLVVDPMGKIVEMPTKSNFREGLSVFEYITSSRGSRKGLTDTAIKTSDAGYLTRRLVDIAHDVIIREPDCGTKEGIVINREGRRGAKFTARVIGRTLAQKVTSPKTKKTLFEEGELLDEAGVALLEEHQVAEVTVYSTLTCQTRHGVCAKCYGWDLSTKKPVDIGAPVGIVAAQSIGEPGTQLTLRTKHFEGIVTADVTQGLPRVEELFEVRTPKALSPMAEIAGKVSLTETDEGVKLTIKTVGVKPADEKEYFVPAGSLIKVEDGQLVDAGTQLIAGSLDVREIFQISGLRAAQQYLIEEVQAVYESHGIPIHDKHIEVIVHKMGNNVRVETSGDTTFLPGELVSKYRFEDENARILAEGGEPATAKVEILGLIQSSLYGTESWLSAASFQETTNILSDAATEGKEDKLLGLKENVIIGRLIPVSPERAQIED